MKKMNPLTFTIIGVTLTLFGIIFTSIGGYLQSQKSENLLDSISDLSQANYNLAEEVKIQADTFQQKVTILSEKNIELTENSIQQANTFQTDIMSLTNRNANLSEELLKNSREEFVNLKKPNIDVFQTSFIQETPLQNSQFKLVVKNSGIDECYTLTLVIEEHNSPLAMPASFRSQPEVPGGAIIEFLTPCFFEPMMFRLAGEEKKKKFDVFFDNFTNKRVPIIVKFHFAYEWNNEAYNTEQYILYMYYGEEVDLTKLDIPRKLKISEVLRTNSEE